MNLTGSIPVMLETAATVVLLLLFSEALLGPLLADETNPESSVVLRLMWPPLYAVIFLFALPRWIPAINLAVRMPLTVLLIGWVGLSVFWSIDQGVTFRRFIAIAMTTVFGLHLAVRYNWREFLTLLGIVWLILAIGSIVFSLAVPALGIEHEEHVGAWKGLWFQKNTLGGHMARASFLFGILIITEHQHRHIWSFGFVLSLGLVLMSTSKTSLLGVLIGLGLVAIGALMRRGPISSLSMIWCLVAFGGGFGFLATTQPELFFALLGRDATLTGRTEIWDALGQLIQQRPIFGYGFGAFWSEGSAQAAYVKDLTQWEVPTAHNGWLETWLAIGIVGVSTFVVIFFNTLVRAVISAMRGWHGLFALGFLLQFFLFSMSESIILNQNAIVWVTFVAVSASLVQQKFGRDPKKLLGSRRSRDFLLVNR